jgi:D-alanyl-D-alanine dipeptidase
MKHFMLLLIFYTAVAFSQSAPDELVCVKEFIPDIVIDLKYNTVDNFLSQKMYTTDECYLARNVVDRLVIIQDSLRNILTYDSISYPQGLGLKIWDGYRPRSVQFLMWEILPDPTYVANPYTGSSHNRGAAVDVTLVDLSTGDELEMPTYFDDFSEMASHTYMNLPANVIANRTLLKNMMTQIGGLSLYNAEWWHYSYPAATSYPLLDFQLK